MKKIDARGLACPKPVILTKKALEEDSEVAILVDNEVARDNIRRFGENGNYEVTILENAQGIEVFLKSNQPKSKTSDEEGLVVLIKSKTFGVGKLTLGHLLMKNFLISLVEGTKAVSELIFMNEGVYLTTTAQDMLPILKELETKGTAIFSCGTCLDFYELKEELKIGSITNMYSATELLVGNDRKVIII